MNSTIELICRHASVRHFTAQAIEEAQRHAILQAARATSSSSFLQLVSIIRVTDPAMRQQLAHLAGEQTYVATAAEFWVFCADFHRNCQIALEAKVGFAEQLLMGCIDTGLMAQNALTAAESLGLGGVLIGGLRNHPAEVTALLGLPQQVLPLFGLCLGHPATPAESKPRLPISLMLHENRYPAELDQAALAEYDTTMTQYYASRSSHTKQQNWSGQIRAILGKESRPFMLAYLQGQGFITR
jgi:nitroreductase